MKTLKNHKWAILLAVAVAGIIVYPQIYLRYDLTDAYHGIEWLGASKEDLSWQTRVREIQDGHPLMANPYFKDAKDDPYVFQPLGSMIVAYLGKALSLDLNNTILLSRVFFSFLVFLVLYAFLFLSTKEKLIAFTIPTALFLAAPLFGRQAIFQLLSGQSPTTSYLVLTRPVNPALTWFFFFGFLLFFWLFLDTSTSLSARKKLIFGGISSLILGLSFYDYFFTWTFLFAFCGTLAIIFFFQKSWGDIKRILIVILGAVLIAIPYFLNLYRANLYSTSDEIKQRIGFIESREPTLGFLVPIFLSIFLLFFPRKWRERYFFFLALAITPFIVLNQQLITGRSPMNAHYHWYFHHPIVIIVLLMMLLLWLSQKKWEFIKKVLAIFIVVISVYTGIFIQSSSYAARREEIIEKQRYGPLMEWFNKNVEKEEVVFANTAISRLIVVYTPLNVFSHPTAAALLAGSRDRLLESLFLFYRLDGVGEEEAQEVFFRDRTTISIAIYGIYYREARGDEADMPDEILQDILQKYKDLFVLSTPDFLNHLLRKYEVKYLVWDKKDNPQWNLGQHPFLKKAEEIGDFVIYRYYE